MNALIARILDETEAGQLPALIAEWGALDELDERYWLARALRLDLALLTGRPELGLPCLARRFAWAGSHHEDAFFRDRPPVPFALRQAREVVEDALAAWRPRRPWLQALRPPTWPIDAGAVEEYRTAANGPLVLGDDVVGIGGAIAWDRDTGRQVPAIAAPPPLPVVWRTVEDATGWGKLALTDGERVVVIEHEHELARGVRSAGDGLVLATFEDLDQYDHHEMIDPVAGAILWRERGACTALAIHGESIGLVVDRAFELRDRRTGKLQARWGCPPASEVAIANSGAVATRSGAVIRVWDPAIASSWGHVDPRVDWSWLDVAFSPDGDRVITGQLLCDTRDGRVVAQLDLDGPGWLEGGPPRNCQAFVRGAIAQILPMEFTLWDPRTGELLTREPDDNLEVEELAVRGHLRIADAGDVVAFDREGRFHAIYAAGQLRVYELHGGQLVFERAWTLARPQLGFATTGAILLVQSGPERFAVDIVEGTVTPADATLAWEPAPVELAVHDGVLEHGGAAIPCDDDRVIVSPDGQQLASRTTHHALRSSTKG